MSTWREHLRSVVDEHFEAMQVLRRRLHMYPEVSGEEFDTSQELYSRFLNPGFMARQGPNGCGVVVDMQDQRSQDLPIFALRADIDALRIQDEKDVPYASRRPNVMHACGHDVHTAIVYGSLMVLRALQERGLIPFRTRFRAIFQPAEEISTGALQMIDIGALEGVACVIATHVDPSRPLGKLGFRKGVFTASCDEMHIRVLGHGGHAARPHEARDPILASAQLIHSLYLHVPRLNDSQDAVVITVGKVEGGHTANVIPESVQLFGTLRTLDQGVRDRTKRFIDRIAQSVASATETQIHVMFGESTPPVNNDPHLIDLLQGTAAEVLGGDSLEQIPRPSMGSEDFSYYGEQLPAAMFRLGCASPRAGGFGLHTSRFDVDEEVLRIGALVMTHAALSWWEQRALST